jgi:hypothetical protein
MPNQMKRRALLALLGLSYGVPARAADRAGVVKNSRGECYAQLATHRRPLQPDAPVFVGDAVATGVQSALGMHLGEATEIRLGAESHLRIDRFIINAGGVLVLERGAMLYDRNPGAGGDSSDVAVRTPYGLLAVRGTRFFAGPSNGVFGVFVERGAVTVVSVNTAVLVTDGLGTDLARPGGEPTTPHPWGAARIAAAIASVS